MITSGVVFAAALAVMVAAQMVALLTSVDRWLTPPEDLPSSGGAL